jgi:uncharacterized membrane protein
MTALLAALLLGVTAGLRAMTPLAILAWAAWLGGFLPAAGWLGWLASPWTVAATSLLAIGELVTDQLPSTPSRKVPVQFATRLLVGAFCGFAVVGMAGALAGLAGAFAGTLGGAAARGALAARFGQDRPAALIEDAVAILLALLGVVLAGGFLA